MKKYIPVFDRSQMPRLHATYDRFKTELSPTESFYRKGEDPYLCSPTFFDFVNIFFKKGVFLPESIYDFLK